MRILALVPGGIGEQLLFFPTLASLKAQYPHAAIDVIVEPRAKSAYRVCAHVNEVLVFDFKDRNGLADYLNLLGIIRDREYEVALNLSRQWQLNLLLWLNGIPLRVGYQGEGALFLSQAIPLQTDQYAAVTYHDLIQGFGIQSSCPPLTINVPKEDIQWAEAEQKRLGLSESGYVLIHGGASRLARLMGADNLYPVAQWHTVIDDIQRKQPNLSLVLLQGPEDEDWIAAMRRNHPQLRTTQPSDIGKLAAMIAGANLMLCPDSAPLHLSVAVGTYTIALFGPTQAAQLIPPHQERCLGLQSKTNKIADILPAEILAKVWRG
ncbi:glycosyltransferase family 9 protein [Synechocystis sp. LKSZ1]|uniref:glycosyltransferase family 9 protein n=1 Tax=Synechocystis sp. LKSZ1 TaxID=3144951 RepID=UPI00336BD95E